MLLAFRRRHSPFPQMTACLRGLDPRAAYEIRNVDTGETNRVTGTALVDDGIPVTIASLPGSVLFTYRKV